MKVSQVVLNQAINISVLGINGVRTLGAGNIRGKEELEVDYVRQVVVVSKAGKTAEIPLHKVEHIIP